MEIAQLVIEALQLAVDALAALRARRPRPGKHERKDTPLTAPAPIRAEVRFHGGSGFRKLFQDWHELTSWLGSPDFTDRAASVRTLTVVAPHPKYRADPDAATPRPRSPVPEWVTRDLPPHLRPATA